MRQHMWSNTCLIKHPNKSQKMLIVILISNHHHWCIIYNSLSTNRLNPVVIKLLWSQQGTLQLMALDIMTCRNDFQIHQSSQGSTTPLLWSKQIDHNRAVLLPCDQWIWILSMHNEASEMAPDHGWLWAVTCGLILLSFLHKTTIMGNCGHQNGA